MDNGDGSYQVSLSPECSGNNLVSVSINGKTIKDMPVTVAVIPTLAYNSLRLKRTITGISSHPLSLKRTITGISHPLASQTSQRMAGFAENGGVLVGGYSDHHVHL